MKYWTELNALEESIYQVKRVQSGLNILMDSELFISNSPDIPEKYKTFISDVNDRLDSAIASVDKSFKVVWDSVRNESFEEDKEDSNRWESIVADLGTKTDTVDLTVDLTSNREGDYDYKY